MINLMLKVPYKEATLEKRQFYRKDRETSGHLENIGIAFLDGYHSSLDFDSLDLLYRSLDQKCELYRGFSYEGAAMGIMIKDTFRRKSKKQFPTFLAEGGHPHIYMLHVGIGWAYARLPFNIEKILPQYDPLLRWLIIDGYGFHEAYFKTKLYVEQQKRPSLSPFATHVFYQGVGRCLWFISGTDINKITTTVASFPAEYHSDLWAGVGLAAVYAGAADEVELHLLKARAGSYLPNLLQGVAFAAKARQRAGLVTPYTKFATEQLTGLPLDDAATITDIALAGLDPGLNSADSYQAWRNAIAANFQPSLQTVRP